MRAPVVVCGVLLVLVLAGCGEDVPGTAAPTQDAPRGTVPPAFLPRLTDAHLPAVLAGLVPGTSTADDLQARFPELQTLRDAALGGTMTVSYNGVPALRMQLPRRPEPGPRARPDGVEEVDAYLVPDAAGVPRVRSLRLVLDPRGGPSLTAWVHAAIGSDPQASIGPGSQREFGHVGKSADAGTYCIGTPDGKAGILVEARTTSGGFGEIEYDLMP